MLLIGESAMSFAHLVNGAVVNVRGRVGSFNFITFVIELADILIRDGG